MKHTYHTRQRTTQQGVSLIEVLVAMLLIAFGMAAMAGMLVYSLNANTNSGNRALATMMAMEYAEQIRANPSELTQANPVYARSDASDYADLYQAAGRNAASLPTLCTYPDCTTTQLATREKTEFARRLKLTLPSGDFVLNKVSNNTADLWILWMEAAGSNNNQSKEGGLDACPAVITAIANATQRPRCLYMRVVL